jgi:hypothetical protein
VPISYYIHKHVYIHEGKQFKDVFWYFRRMLLY